MFQQHWQWISESANLQLVLVVIAVTIGIYVALGNLYRSKGDIERAIRIRQTIILRPNIDEQIKIRALVERSNKETGEGA
jgi:lipopolysaccharide biosynthesis regulator YciM